MKQFILFIKQEIVLVVAGVLAICSLFIVPPDSTYVDYIDFRTLAILFSLMATMSGFQKIGIFDLIARKMIQMAHSMTGVVAILVLLCFFSSMVITNDVALITFVPLTFICMDQIFGEEKDKKKSQLVIVIVILQTLAANLGSMMTPLGNPQNLYLYGKSGLGFLAFIKFMLPLSVMSFVLILLCIFAMKFLSKGQNQSMGIEDYKELWTRTRKTLFAAYVVLFILELACVLRFVDYPVMFFIVLGAMILLDIRFKRGVLLSTDFSLIFTFVFLFVFIGNLGRLDAFRDFVQSFVTGREVLSAILASQVISNVPAAILLSGFTKEYGKLLIGTNLGGLGTLIASMASLISYKYLAKYDENLTGKYFALFTISNVVFLLILVGGYCLLG